jgi:hypothetical protein
LANAWRRAVSNLQHASLVFLGKNSKVLVVLVFDFDSLKQLFLSINNLALFLLLPLNPLLLNPDF